MTSAQVDDTTSTPSEAFPQERTTVVLGKHDPLGDMTEGTMHASSDPYFTGPDTEESEATVEVTTQEQQDWSNLARPPFILSFVDSDHPNGGFVIGWDTCGACLLHIRSCKCKNGPEQPRYVKNWRPAADKNHDKPQTLTTTQRKAVVTADPDEVAAKVAEATEDMPTGRKRRSDAGKPRGPRKDPNATPESVAEAAGDLSAAMSKE